MQMYTVSGHQFYYYTFPSVEDFADVGRVEIVGTNPATALNKVTAVFTYTASSVQLEEINGKMSTFRNFPIGESEATPASSSLNFCDSYRAGTHNLQAMAKSVGTLNSCLILPIKLTSFSYSKYNRKVVLNWETAAEPDNVQFVVERSVDGITFETLNSVPGLGNNAVNRYQVEDASPRYVNHYRLKQVDAQGRIEYSKILYVKINDASPLHVLNTIVTDRVVFSVDASDKIAQTTIYNMNGQSMYTTKTKQSTNTVDISGWTKGKYIIRVVTTDGQAFTEQFVKQ